MISHEPIEATEKLFTRIHSRAYQDWVRLGAYLLILGIFMLLLGMHRLDSFEDLALDNFLKKITWGQVRQDIALIEIPDSSLAEIGPWPWPRSYHAILVRLLNEWRASAIVLGFDLSKATDPKNDMDLSQVLAQSKVPVYLSAELMPKKDKEFWIHEMPVVWNKGDGKMIWSRPLPEFEKHAKALGYNSLAPDPDGVLRRFAPFLSDGTTSYPFLPLCVAFDAMKKSIPPSLAWRPFSDGREKVLIPWSARWDRDFQRYHYADLIHSYYAIQKGTQPVVDPRNLAGKLCLVGPAFRGAADRKVTPINIAYPMMGVYAQVLNSALTGEWVRPVPFWGNALCLLVVGGIAAFLFMALTSTWSLIAGLLLGLGWILFCFWIFATGHFWFYGVYPLLLILCLFIFSAIYVQLNATREKSRLFHLATRDGLTELYVIRHFRLILNQIVREASIRKEPLSVALLDLDHFKKINDTYGHPAGDMVLKKTAEILLTHTRKRRPFREIDFAARYGGEEFIVMFRHAGLQEAARVAAERIRKKIEEANFEWNGHRIPVTVSVGVATLRSGENVPDPMVHRADAALYQAKQDGRNRICLEKD